MWNYAVFFHRDYFLLMFHEQRIMIRKLFPTFTHRLFRLFFAAVRYGRVPKRTRDIGGNSIVEDLANGLVTSNNQQSIVLTSVRVVNSVTSSSPTAQSTAPIVTSTYLSASNGSSSGGQATLVSSQMCSTTTMIEASHNKPGNICEASHNNNNNNNNSDEQELSVYDVILCVSQAHRTHCTYTENVRKVLNNQSPSTMPTHHPSSASTINTNNLISSSSATQNNSMDDNGVSEGWLASHAVAVFDYSRLVASRLPHQLLRVWNISEFISGNSTPWEWHREFTPGVQASEIEFTFRSLTD